MASQASLRITMAFLAVFVFMNFISSNQLGQDIDLFNATQRQIATAYPIPLTPNDTIVGASWLSIYIWVAATLIYAYVFPADSTFYTQPVIASLLLALFSGIVWPVVFSYSIVTRQALTYSAALNVLSWLSLTVGSFILYKQFAREAHWSDDDASWGKRLFRVVALNGLPAYGAWMTMVWQLCTFMSAQYAFGVPAEEVGMALGFGTFLAITTYFTVAEVGEIKACTHVASPYIVWEWYLLNTVLNQALPRIFNEEPLRSADALMLMNLATNTIFLVVKLIFICSPAASQKSKGLLECGWGKRKQPLSSSQWCLVLPSTDEEEKLAAGEKPALPMSV